MSSHPHPALPGPSSHRRPRKISAYRSPYSSSSSSSLPSSLGPTRTTPSSASASHTPYPTPTILFTLLHDSAPVQYEHLLASTNTRYPGAPGTALAKAREAAVKAAQAAKREADKKRRDKEELIRLGVGEKMGKRSRDTNSATKRSESPFTANANGSGSSSNPHNVPSNISATRRSPRDKDKGGDFESSNGSKSRRTSVVRSSPLDANTPATALPQSNDHLSVPGAAHTLNGSGRIRKPASRGNSPVPLTEANRIPEGSISTSSPLTHGLGLSGYHPSIGNGPLVHAANRLGAAITTQPFQSSPLARDSIKSFPTTTAEPEVAEAPLMRATRSRKGSSVSPSPLIKPQKTLANLAADEAIAKADLTATSAGVDANQSEDQCTAAGRKTDQPTRITGKEADRSNQPQASPEVAADKEIETPHICSKEGASSAPKTSSPVLPAGITA